jgi:hypothetical protein
MSLPFPPYVLTIIIGVVALAAGILIGRLTGSNRQEVLELAAKLESAGKERELAQASVAAAKDEVARTREQLDQYRGEVVEHFTGTSRLLRDLTHQYREVYDHLATSAGNLCPEGSVDFLEGLQPDQIPAGEGDPQTADTSAASDDESAPEKVAEAEA